MSIHYSLAISKIAPSLALSKLIENIPEHHQENYYILSPGLLISTNTKPSKLTIDIIEDEFGFTPTVNIVINWYQVDVPLATRINLIKGCMEVINNTNCDAVLLFEAETIVFLYKNGKLVLNKIDGFWVDEVLVVIPIPYEFELI